MKKAIQMLVLTFIICCGNNILVNAQDKSLGASVTAKVGVYVFPAKGQDAAQQDKDESDCYTWAVQQSGVDPLNPPKVEATQVQKGPDGAAVGGAARGAAGGAAIGAICGDAGKGAGGTRHGVTRPNYPAFLLL